MRTGTTLAELAAALALLATVLALALPSTKAWSDWAALHGAREAVVSLVAGARRAGVTHGRATLVLSPEPSRARLEADGRVLAEALLEEAWGVSIVGDRVVVLSWDGLGLGRFASRTLRFERGGHSSELVISSYGRVRRR